MKNFVVFVFALAVAASLLAACNATPCGASDWYQPAVIPLPDVGLASSIGWGPWVGNYVGSVSNYSTKVAKFLSPLLIRKLIEKKTIFNYF